MLVEFYIGMAAIGAGLLAIYIAALLVLAQMGSETFSPTTPHFLFRQPPVWIAAGSSFIATGLASAPKWWMKGATIVIAVTVLAAIIGASACGSDDDALGETEVTSATATPVPDAATANLESDEPTGPALLTLTSEECTYLGELQSILSSAVTGSNDVGESFLEAVDDPLVILDQTWVLEVAAGLAMVRLSYDDVSDLSAPESLSDIHDAADAALSKLDDATRPIASGIDDRDADQMNEGAALFVSAAEDMRALPALIVSFRAARSGEC